MTEPGILLAFSQWKASLLGPDGLGQTSFCYDRNLPYLCCPIWQPLATCAYRALESLVLRELNFQFHLILSEACTQSLWLSVKWHRLSCLGLLLLWPCLTHCLLVFLPGHGQEWREGTNLDLGGLVLWQNRKEKKTPVILGRPFCSQLCPQFLGNSFNLFFKEKLILTWFQRSHPSCSLYREHKQHHPNLGYFSGTMLCL